MVKYPQSPQTLHVPHFLVHSAQEMGLLHFRNVYPLLIPIPCLTSQTPGAVFLLLIFSPSLTNLVRGRLNLKFSGTNLLDEFWDRTERNFGPIDIKRIFAIDFCVVSPLTQTVLCSYRVCDCFGLVTVFKGFEPEHQSLKVNNNYCAERSS